VITCSHDELVGITKKKYRPAQVRVLLAAGIKHKVMPDGTVLVSRAHIEHLLGGVANAKVRASKEPNWAALAPAA
jgi:hypothetical protein